MLRRTLLLVLVAACSTKDPPAAPDSGPGEELDAGPPAPPKVELGRHDVKVVSTEKVIPGPGLPPEAPAQNSNNNLDVVRFKDRVYLAWRTGPDHYASPQVRIHVVSSTDEKT